MFYSELLLMECSEAELGDGAWKPLQRQRRDRSRVWRLPHPPLPFLAYESLEEGPQMLTLLFKNLSE